MMNVMVAPVGTIPLGHVTAKQLAERLNLSKQTVHNWAREGRLPRAVRVPGRPLLWRVSDISAWEKQMEAVCEVADTLRACLKFPGLSSELIAFVKDSLRVVDDERINAAIRTEVACWALELLGQNRHVEVRAEFRERFDRIAGALNSIVSGGRGRKKLDVEALRRVIV